MKVATMHNYIVRVPYYNLAIPFDKVSIIQCIGKGWGPLLIGHWTPSPEPSEEFVTQIKTRLPLFKDLPDIPVM
jgi:hypothetical protein